MSELKPTKITHKTAFNKSQTICQCHSFLFQNIRGATQTLINSKDTKVRPNHNTKMWQIRSSAACCKYTLACHKSHHEYLYNIESC